MICVGEYIRQNAKRVPDRVALIDGARRWTYEELDSETDAIAYCLMTNGIKPGDRVALLAAPSGDWVRCFLAIAKAGGIATGLNYRETPDRLDLMMRDVGVSILFADDERRALMADIQLPCKMLELSQDTLDAVAGKRVDWKVSPQISPSDGAVILFTGGTTGISKGVLLSHANLFWNVVNEALDTRMTEFDRTLVATALHHSAALNTWLLPSLYLGATAVVLPEFTPEGWLEAVSSERVTNGFAPPTMIRQVIKHPDATKIDWSCFKRWYSGAGILSAHERAEMEALIPGLEIYYEYGLTEAGPIVTCLKPDDYHRAPQSIGRAVLNCDIRILREDRTKAGRDEIGEIAVRGPAVMQGYYNRPDETARVFHDGWLLTGDLASMDVDGFLTFHDRSKDMIKTGGLNVYSQEVEQAISRHPSVREVAVIGVPDDTWGEMVTAVVTPHDGTSLTQDEVIAFARGSLGGYQTPKRVIFMAYDDLPRNYLGKILKKNLRVRLRAGEGR